MHFLPLTQPQRITRDNVPPHKAAALLAPAFWSANSRTIDRLVFEGHATKTVDEDTGIDVVYRGLEVGEDPDLPDDRLDLHLMFLPDMKKA
jgi:hypothetical protein